MERFLEFANHHPQLVGIAALLAVAVVAVEAKRALRRWREVGPFEATLMINDGALLLDLRDAAAHRAGHIAGSVATSLTELERTVGERSKDAAIVAYCETGTVSAQAAARLSAAGYRQVVALRGGLAGWRAESLPLAAG